MTGEEYYQIIVDKFVFKVRKGYYYCSDDSWAKIGNGVAKLGISDFLQKTGGDMAFVELPKVGANVKQFDEIGQLETIKAVFSIVSPVSGVIIDVNQKLEDTPELINEDPYESGWISSVKLDDLDEDLKHLLDAETYLELMKKKIEADQELLKK